MRKIGYIYKNYPEKRCIINKSDNKYIYYNLRKNLIYKIKSLFQKLKMYNFWNKQSLIYVPSIGVDIWHTFNQILKTEKNYIITFETAVPRNEETIERRWEWDSLYKSKFKLSKKQLRYLEKSNCKRLLALSNNAKNIMRYQLENISSDKILNKNIMKKVEVLFPPQEELIDEKKIKNKFRTTEKIKFIYIGNDYFRKGGYALVEALKRVSTENIELVLVTSFTKDDISYLSNEEWKAHLRYLNMQPWIKVVSNISNEEVLNILQHQHVGFLPTIQDTFGYSVLEMQASGCPVVSTDIRALSEINNDACGWLINVKKHEISGEAFYHEEEECKRLIKGIEDRLVDVISNILTQWEMENSEYFINKANQGLKRIIDEHNPESYRKRLNMIFDSCLEG